MARAGYIILERDGFRCVYCGYSPVDGDDVVLTVVAPHAGSVD